MNLLSKYNARSISELYDKCFFSEWQEITAHNNYHELLKTAIELYIKYNLDEQRKDMLKYAFDTALLTAPDENQLSEISRLFTVNNVDPYEFASALKHVLQKEDAKINTLRIIGVPNSGKTLIANCICKPFICCYNNNHGSENEFYLSNMLNKSIILCEELYITTATAEDLKSILGGQPIDIAKKFFEKQLISRTPIVVTSNYSKFGRGHLPPTDENALALRCKTFQFIIPFKPTCKIEWQQFYLFLYLLI